MRFDLQSLNRNKHWGIGKGKERKDVRMLGERRG